MGEILVGMLFTSERFGGLFRVQKVRHVRNGTEVQFKIMDKPEIAHPLKLKTRIPASDSRWNVRWYNSKRNNRVRALLQYAGFVVR